MNTDFRRQMENQFLNKGTYRNLSERPLIDFHAHADFDSCQSTRRWPKSDPSWIRHAVPDCWMPRSITATKTSFCWSKPLQNTSLAAVRTCLLHLGVTEAPLETMARVDWPKQNRHSALSGKCLVSTRQGARRGSSQRLFR